MDNPVPQSGVRRRRTRLAELAPAEMLLIVLFAALIGMQVIGPYFVGLANNGDFEKISDLLQLRPPQGWESLYWDWAVRDYVPVRAWWESGLRSSETLLARLALGLARLFGNSTSFDIRLLGAIHALLLVAAFAVLVRLLRPLGVWPQVAIGGLASWIFSDVYLVAYLNTFYMDTAAAVGLLLMVAVGLRLLLTERPGIPAIGVFTAAALLWTCSKSQHALWGLTAAAVPLAVLHRRSDFRYHKAALFAIVAIVLSSIWCVRVTPRYYAGSALSKLIFLTLIPSSPDRAQTAAEFGLRADELKYVDDQRAFAKGSPLMDLDWLDRFARRVGYRDVMLYYVRHPGRAWRRLIESYSEWGARLRPEYLGNFLPEQGPPAHGRNGLPRGATCEPALFAMRHGTCRSGIWQPPDHACS